MGNGSDVIDIMCGFEPPSQTMAAPIGPYGACQCVKDCDLSWCGGRGPASWSVTREGKTLQVCSRCRLSGDTNKRLLVKKTDALSLFESWDSMGTELIRLHLTEDKWKKGKK
jgi:hypothetical protein